jgi:transposase
MNNEQMIVVREICRFVLTTDQPVSEIARVLNTSRKRVSKIKKRLKLRKLSWDAVEQMGDAKLKRTLYPRRKNRYKRRKPNWIDIHEKMRHKHQTLIQLWEEYRLIDPTDAYSYSQFTALYAQFIKTVDITMRMVHHPGECVFVDFAGLTIPWQDGDTERKAHIFVAVSGASNYTFAMACRDQSAESWIDAHNKMFFYFDGVHAVVVPDNLKAAVILAGAFPTLNRIYLELARYYETVIAPARVRKPQDKSKAEAGVLFVSRWITAPLRRRKFFSLEEVNEAIRELLPALNERKFRKLPGTRHSRFLEIDKPALKPLPAKPFEYVTWVSAQKVPADYHLYVDEHAYSLPYKYVGKQVEACFSNTMVQFYFDGKRIASHKRSFEKGGRTLDKSHMTKAHKAYSERQLGDFLIWAKSIGVYAVSAVEAQFDGKPEYSYSAAIACDKLKRLCSLHDKDRFEAACKRASLLRSLTVKTIQSILSRRVEALDMPEELSMDGFPAHQNVRGSNYFQNNGEIQ